MLLCGSPSATAAAARLPPEGPSQYLFPRKELPETGREVRSLAGARTSLRGPVPLTIQICGVTLSHPVYFCENVKTYLLGYDVVSAAALVIDT